MDRQEKMDILAQSLQKAKKVMQEVEHRTGNKSFGNQPGRQSYTEQDTDALFEDNTRYLSESEAMQRQPQISQRQSDYDLYSDYERELPIAQPQNSQTKFMPFKNLNNSKMPREILESFMQTPPIDPTQPLGMETLFEKVRGSQPQPQPQPQQQRRAAEPIVEYRNQPAPITESKSNLDIHLLEYVIKKTVEETLKQVQEQTNINENIQIKIGDKTFGGKISSLKKLK